MIYKDNGSPQQWPLGRITNTCSGADGRVRVIDIKTAKGVLRRPIRKVAPLPILKERPSFQRAEYVHACLFILVEIVC